jgi:hypothetical protein
MDAPARYRYDPPWQYAAVAGILAAGVAIAVSTGYCPRSIGVIAITVFGASGACFALRRYAFPRYLVIENDGVWIPSGFLRMHVRHLDFAEISALWVAPLVGMEVICLRHRGKTFEICSALLPDFASYQAVGESIFSRLESSLLPYTESEQESRLHGMLGKLHLTGLTLGIGAIGLFWFYGRVFPPGARLFVGAALCLPWLTIHTITFFNRPPIGPLGFRRCLLGLVCAYASLIVAAESIQFIDHFPNWGNISVTTARVVMYAGCICFIPFARAYLVLRDS